MPNKGKGEKSSLKKSGDEKTVIAKQVELKNSQCSQATVNQVGSDVRSLDISGDDASKKVTRSGSVKRGILQQM